MRELGATAKSAGSVYFAGGSTALLLGLREQTIDIDLKFDPEPEGVFEAIALLKEKLEINVELASPGDFIPPPADWRARSIEIATFGALRFFHYDLVAQVLAKVERGHAQDLRDALDLVRRGFVRKEDLAEKFSEIKPKLVRYPAIDPNQFERKIREFLESI